MGWKNIKDHFKIGHQVCVTGDGICIGSGYVHNIVQINPDTGEVFCNATFSGFLQRNYPALADATKNEILNLINTEDTFAASLSVYTYENGKIIEKQCEEHGWPNATHDGELMYNNTFFSDKAKAIEAALDYAKAANIFKCRNDIVELPKLERGEK